jgi:hypothetical protein
VDTNSHQYPIPISISDKNTNSQPTQSWIQDLINVGNQSSEMLASIDKDKIWHLAISTPTLEIAASAFLFGWLSHKILHNPISKSPKRITTDSLKPGIIVAGYRRASSNDFPLGREFSGRVTNVQSDLNPPRFSVQVNKKDTKTIITEYVTDLFELNYEGNEENFLGSWDETNRTLENHSPWEILLGVKKQALGDFLQPSILMNMPISNYQEEKDLIFDFKIGETAVSYSAESLISRASPGKLHSNFLEVNSIKRDANSNYEDFELHLMNGSRAILENIDFSSERMKVYIISRGENSSESAIETISDRRNSGFEIPLLSGVKLESESLEFLAFGTSK